MPDALAGAAVSFRILADGSPRVTVDFSPQDATAVFALLGKPGQPVAVCALRDGYDMKSNEPAVKRDARGPLCKEACDLCALPAFQQWCVDRSGGMGDRVADLVGRRDEASAKAYILEICAITSRKELDTNSEAGEYFKEAIRKPFMAWQRKQA